MALFLGGNKLKIRIDSSICRLIVPASSQTTEGVRLVSLDKYVLKDSNGVYLTAKEVKQ